MKSLYVKSFGPVKKAEIELKRINLFIGEQSVGKSTLAKLITIMTDYYNLAMIVKHGADGWNVQLKQYGLDSYVNGDFIVRFIIEESNFVFRLAVNPKSVTSSLKKDGKLITNKSAIVSELLKLKPVYHKDSFIEQLEKARTKAKKREQDSDILPLILLLNNSIYIPAERIIYSLFSKLQSALTLAKDTVSITFLRFMLELVKAQSKYSHYESDLLKITYINEGQDDFIIDNRCNERIPLSVASSGIQSTIPLLLVLENVISNSEYSSIVIEELETNLFPSKQVELLRYVLYMVIKNKRNLTITTHSPYVLSAMNNYLFAGSIANEFGEKGKDSLRKDLPQLVLLSKAECSVYSLGEDINHSGEYCVSLIDEETGMIDTNSLDVVSGMMATEFGHLEDLYAELFQRSGKL